MEPEFETLEEELHELRNTISLLKEIIKVQNNTICRLVDTYIIKTED